MTWRVHHAGERTFQVEGHTGDDPIATGLSVEQDGLDRWLSSPLIDDGGHPITSSPWLRTSACRDNVTADGRARNRRVEM